MDLTNEDNVVSLMLSSKNEGEWNDNCDKVKYANGDYPDWWFGVIMMGGIFSRAQSNWRR